jgi:hypothetical protein
MATASPQCAGERKSVARGFLNTDLIFNVHCANNVNRSAGSCFAEKKPPRCATKNLLRQQQMKFRFLLSFFSALLFCFTGNAIAPFINSFTPNYGASNDPGNIIISGGGFSNVNLVVKFNGVRDTSAFATAADGSTIQAHVPTGAPKGTGPVVVSVNGVLAPTNNGVYFTVIGPSDPYVDGFSPGAGNPGTSVTITGTHFIGVTAIKFNGAAASGYSITADNFVTLSVPANATTGPISVEKSGVFTNSTSANFFVSPVITSFSPTFGRAGTNVVIRGSSFSNTFAVKFNNINALTFNVDSNSQITAVVPNNATTGPIRVEAPGGTNITSGSFLVQPTIFSFTPGFGAAGTNVTITGANLNAGSLSVKFNGVTASAGAPTFGSVIVTAPASTTGPIVVTTVDGAVTSSVSFYYLARITGFTPTNSAPGTTVTISGTNFTGAAAATDVTFNGQPAASFVVSNNNTVGAVVPNGVSAGPISITTPAGSANSTGLFYGAPVINNFVPTQGAPGTRVQINGTNFLGATMVLFNGTSASFNVTNNGVIGATVPNNAQTGPITVVAPAGTNISAGTFTLILTSDLNVGVVDSPDPVFVGSNLVYTITVANTGPDAAPNVILTNKLPASVNLKSATSSQGTLNTNLNPVTAAFGTINSSGIATVTLTVVPQIVGSITNLATIGSDNTDPTLTDHTNIISTLVWPLPFLSIQNLTSNQIKVFWPAPLSNFTLLFKSNLVPSVSWNTDLTTRVLSGTNVSVTETNFGATKFFRLKQ